MSSPPVTEIVALPVSSLFKEDPSKWQSVLDKIADNKGFQRESYGKTLEDENIVQLFIDWDSYEAHAAFMNDPSYVPFGAEIKPLLSAPLSMIHVPLTPFPPTDAFQGPIVELATFNLKSGTVHSEFTTAFKGLHDTCVSRPGCKGAAYGFTREDENQFIFIASWLSKEHHTDFQKSPEFPSLVEPFSPSLIDFKVVHVDIKHRT